MTKIRCLIAFPIWFAACILAAIAQAIVGSFSDRTLIHSIADWFNEFYWKN